MEKPPKITLEEFSEITEIKDFNKVHKTKLKSWKEVFNSDDHWSDNETCYARYLIWYTKTYSKLGRALS